jgi:type IV fimbrial biogenesis protein FimT
MAAIMGTQRIGRHSAGCTRDQGGFSLVELLVVTTIVATVMALALPSMAIMLGNQKIGALASTLLVSLQLARSDAVRRGGTTVVCKSSDGTQCALTGGWEQGWIVFEDADQDALRSPGERLLARQDAAPSGLSISGNTPVVRYVSYTAQGSTRMASGALQAGTLTICAVPSGAGVDARQVVLAATGRARIQAGRTGVCP